MAKSVDEYIKNALVEGTKDVPELKDEVWSNIQDSINKEKGVSRMTKKKNIQKSRPSILRFAAIASLFVFVFLTSTQYGQAAIDKIKILFEPEKQITENIEGMQEEKEYTLNKGQKGYIIYIDESMYEKEVVGGKDRFVPKNKAEHLPEMYMEISQVEDKSPQEVANQMEDVLKEEYAEFKNQGMVEEPIKALHLASGTGNDTEDVLVKHYLVDNTEGGTFIIKLQYTMEAAEGHGARFWHMLTQFKVVNIEDIK